MLYRSDPSSQGTREKPIHTHAIWSIVLGVLSMPPFPFGFVTGLPAITLGRRARRAILETDEYRGLNLARGGEILGYVSIVLTLILVALILTGVLKP